MATAAVPEGFDEAFDDLLARAAGVGRRILGDPVAAEDVAAETLARAFAHWRRIGTAPWREGWVVRVATNLAIDAVRARSRVERHHGDEQLAPVVADDPVTDAALDRMVLANEVRQLPRRQREAVALRYLSGLSEAEVADALQVSAGSVKTHLHRGVARLRQRLGERAPVELIEEALVDG